MTAINIYLINEHSCNFYVFNLMINSQIELYHMYLQLNDFPLSLISIYTLLKPYNFLLNRHHIHSYTQETVPKNYFKIKICTPAELLGFGNFSVCRISAVC